MVLHRRVERLLDRTRKPVNLVDEEDRAGLERREEGCDVALALERGTGGLHERHVELPGGDVRKRGLAEAGRAGEQHVVERLPPAPCRLDEQPELALHLVLADEVLEPARAERAVELLLARPGHGDLQADLGFRRRTGHAAFTRPRRAAWMSASGAASAPVSSVAASSISSASPAS